MTDLCAFGAGVYPLARTRRAEQGLIPVGVRRINDAAQTFEPEKSTVRLKNGDAVTYDYLVVCTGVKLDWGKVAGLSETLGKNGVCSNYSPAHATYIISRRDLHELAGKERHAEYDRGMTLPTT
jgi:sulfide:quinone oxidoreductase